jgi:hypothetical protein
MKNDLIILLIIAATISSSCNPNGYVRIGNVYESDHLAVSDFTFWKAPLSDWIICSLNIQAKVDGYVWIRLRANLTEGRYETNTWLR